MWNPSVQNHHLKLNIDGSSSLYGALTTGGNATIGGELVADGGYFGATNRGLFLGTSYAGTDTFAGSLNIRDGYLAVYDPALYGYGLVINGSSMVKTNGAHDMVCLAVITLGQDEHVYAPQSYVVTSSEKIKSNIRPVEDNDLIHNISFKRYSNMHTRELGVTWVEHDDMGIIAEDIQFLDPTNHFKIVVEKDDKIYIDYNKLFLLRLVEIQKNRKIITDLKTEITDLKNSIARLLPLLDHPIFKHVLINFIVLKMITFLFNYYKTNVWYCLKFDRDV